MMAPSESARILVVALRRLGDVLLTTPLIRSLKRAWPDAHIDVLVVPQRMRLILLPTRGMPGTDAVIIEDFLFERAPPSGAVVRLLSSGVPSKQDWVTYYLSKRRYWEMALARLKVLLEKGLDQEQPKPRY